MGWTLWSLGAANSAVDVALETYRKGAKSVTLVIREKEVGQNVKYWARPDIVNRNQRRRVFKPTTKAQITAITPKSVQIINPPEGAVEISTTILSLAMTGYQPDFSLT